MQVNMLEAKNQLSRLVRPLARQQSELLLRYQNWLRHFHWLGINDTTVSMATELRASRS